MSVLPLAFPTVQDQLVGLSVHLSPPEKIMSLPSYWSMKCSVVAAFKGTPARVKTPPPLIELVIQSPASALGRLANRSPSMLKPPAGTMTGATPAGGGAASAGWLPKTRKARRRRTKETGVSNLHLAGELIECFGIMEKVPKRGSVPFGTSRRPRLSGMNFNFPEL